MFRRSPIRTIRRRLQLCVEELESREVLSVASIPTPLATPNDPRFSQLYGMEKIQAPAAWNLSTGSASVVIADIDTGVDYTHPDLYKNIWINQGELPQSVKDTVGTTPVTFYDLNTSNTDGSLAFAAFDVDGNHRIDGKDALSLWSDGSDADGNGYIDDLIGWNFVNDTNNPLDDDGHGTHTAGTIGAMGNNTLGVTGVNWQVQIMALKFMAPDGGDLDDAAAAIRYAVDMGAAASNNSWSYARGTTGDVVYEAIQYAQAHHHLIIAAAGNNSANNDTSVKRSYPASFALSNIISVAATDAKDAKASWSAYGRTTVDLGAPGVSIVSTVPGGKYASYSGTSMAAPHVTGTVALILALRPDLASSASTVKSLILSNVDRVASLATKTVSGGRLNAFKAVTAALTATALPDSGEALASSSGSSTSSKSGKSKALRAMFESAALELALNRDAFDEGDAGNARRARAWLDALIPASNRKLEVTGGPSLESKSKALIVACTGSLAGEETDEGAAASPDGEPLIYCGGDVPVPREESATPECA